MHRLWKAFAPKPRPGAVKRPGTAVYTHTGLESMLESMLESNTCWRATIDVDQSKRDSRDI